MLITCAHCGMQSDKPTGAVNRAARNGNRLYCDVLCAGFGRRHNKSDQTKREAKRLYDMEYRARNAAMLKVKKHQYFLRTYDPAKAAVERKSRAKYHAEYCRRPEYRALKSEYDRKYRAIREYGEFAECFILTLDIRRECLSQQSDYEIRLEKGTLNKKLQRKRDYDRLDREEPEIGPLGNLELRQGGQDGARTSRLHCITSPRNPPDDEHTTSHCPAIKTFCVR